VGETALDDFACGAAAEAVASRTIPTRVVMRDATRWVGSKVVNKEGLLQV